MENDVVENKEEKNLIVSNEDFEMYFKKKEWITKEEYENFLKLKWNLILFFIGTK